MASRKKGEPANRSKEGKKRTYAKRTPQARAYAKPGKVKESGVGAYSAIRLAQAAARNASGTVKTSKGRPAKKKTIGGPYGEEVVRTKASAKSQSRHKAADKKAMKKAIKDGEIQVPKKTSEKFTRYGKNKTYEAQRNVGLTSNSSRQKPAPKKPSKSTAKKRADARKVKVVRRKAGKTGR